MLRLYMCIADGEWYFQLSMVNMWSHVRTSSATYVYMKNLSLTCSGIWANMYSYRQHNRERISVALYT